MIRIVGGRWGGRRLVTPDGETTRPTSEKVRAALASSLTSTGGLEGARVLDLFAGSGALGLELVSRGAAAATFVERDRAALTALRANVATLGGGMTGLVVVPGDVVAVVNRAGLGGPFDVVVVDPPYDLARDAVLNLFGELHRSGALGPHADLVLETSARAGEPTWPEPLTGDRTRKYGDTLLCYGRGP